ERLPAVLAGTAGLTPIEVVRAGLAALPDAGEEDHLAVAAAVPVLLAGALRVQHGERPLYPDPDAGHVADTLRLIRGRPAPAEHVRAFETYLVTVADHGMNASTFTAR